jgi:carbon-monoxide dehydrogenase large subunit
MKFKAIHSDLKRTDGVAKVTGAALYAGDLAFPGMLSIKVLRSPYAHARILNIDISEARAISGVAAVLTGKDIPGPFGVAIKDQYPIARNKVRFAGEPVAAVVAGSKRQAHEAAKLIKVDYEQLPFNVVPRKAALPDAPIIHEQMMDYQMAPWIIREGGNVYQHFKVRKGNALAAFDACDVVVEGEYSYPYIQHAMMEPHCAIGRYSANGSFTMHATTQGPYVVQECISELLEIPQHKVRVVAPYLGGGFGGKSDITIEALIACCARAVPGRYVKLQLTREEMFGGVTLARGGDTHYRLGFNQEGRLLAMQGQSWLGSGATADCAVFVATGMALAGAGPYAVDDLSLDVYGVYTNNPPIGALRAYGHPEVHLAVESLMDKAAQELGIPAYELRLKNLLGPGKVNGIGQRFTEHSGNVIGCTEKVVASLYAKPKPDKGARIAVGRGLASYMKTPCMPANVQSGARIKLNADGSVLLAAGAVEMGQGTTTVLCQI